MARHNERKLDMRIKEIQEQFKNNLNIELTKTQAILAGLSRQGERLEFRVGVHPKRKKKKLVLDR